MRRRPLLWMACVFVTGVCYGLYRSIWFALVAAGILLYICPGMFRWDFGGRKNCCGIADRMKNEKPPMNVGRIRFVVRILAVSVFFVLGAERGSASFAKNRQVMSRIEDGEKLILSGELYKKELKNNQYTYYLKKCSFIEGTGEIFVKRVIFYSQADCCAIGESLKIQGQVHMFSQARNEGNFDQRQFYRSQQIAFSVKNVRVLERGGRQDQIAEGLFHLRKRLAQVYRESLSLVNAGVLSAMLLGEKSQLDEEIKVEYRSAGISHILAISGLHVSLLGMVFYRFLRKRGAGFLWAFIWAGSFLLLYACMTGESVSTQRAVGMLFFAMFGEVIGRSYDSLSALGGMVILLLWENPFWLEYAGFVFSVVAVVGIVVVGGVLRGERWDDTDFGEIEAEGKASSKFGRMRAEGKEGSKYGRMGVKSQEGEIFRERKKKCLGLREKWSMMFWGSIGVWLATVPLTAFYYYEVPVYSVFLNLAILPLLKVLFGFGIVGLMGGLAFENLGKILLLPCEWILNVYDRLADFALALPGASRIVGKPAMGRLLCYYGFLAVFCLWCYHSKKRIKQAGEEEIEDGENLLERICRRFRAGRILGIGVLLLVFFCPGAKEFKVDVLDVGQGDGIYICTSQGVSLFIDGGSTSVREVGKYRILPFLKSKGVSHISYWFVSHADKDHISGLEEILKEGYRIENLVLSFASLKENENSKEGEILTSEHTPAEELKDLSEKYGVTVLQMQTGDVLLLGEAKVTCLGPDKEGRSRDENDLSLILDYEDLEFSGIFAGDISAQVEKELLQKGNCPDVRFYKVSHHGSKYSGFPEFLEELSPEISVISCGKNSYGHPHKETLERLDAVGTDVFRTDEGGQITVKMRNGKMEVKKYVE